MDKMKATNTQTDREDRRLPDRQRVLEGSVVPGYSLDISRLPTQTD